MKKSLIKILPLLIIWVFLAAFAGVNIYQNRNIFSFSFNVSYPYKPKIDKENNLLIITDSMRKVVKINNVELKYVPVLELNGGDVNNKKTFFNAWDSAIDDEGNIYILNVSLNDTGILVDREEIIKFDSAGKYLTLVYEKDYTKLENTQKHIIGENAIISLSYKNGNLYFFEKNANSLIGYKYDTASRNPVSVICSIEQEFATELILNVSYVPENNILIYNDRKSRIIKYDFNTRSKEIIKITNETDEKIYWVSAAVLTVDNFIYFIDHNNGKIYKYNIYTKEKELLIDSAIMQKSGYGDESLYFTSLYINDNNTLVCENGNNILVLDRNGKIISYGNSFKYSLNTLILKVSVLVSLILSVLSLLIFFVVVIYKNRKKISNIFYRSVVIVCAILLCAYLIGSSILTSFTNRYESEVFNNLSLLSQMISKEIDTERVANLNKPDDFLEEDYNALKLQIHGIFNNSSDPWNDMYYVSLFKVIDEELFTVFYFTDYEGVYHKSQIPYKDTAYENAYKNNQISHEKFTDIYGDWMYSTAPIYGKSGELIGVIEVGRDLNSFKTETERLLSLIVRSIAAILVVLILFITELAIIETVNENKKKMSLEKVNEISENDSLAVRPASFLIELAISIPMALIPIFAKNIYSSGSIALKIPESVVVGLPVSAEMLLLALSSIFAGKLIEKIGYKITVTLGVIALIAGNVLSGFSDNIFTFILARSLAGAGGGCLYFSNKYFAVLTSSKNNVNTSLSIMNAGILAGANFGVTLGSVLTNNFQIKLIFFLSAFCFIIAFIYIYKVLFFIVGKYKNKKDIFNDDIYSKEEKKGSLLSFLINGRVWLFFILFFIPVCATNMFFRYFVPVYAQERGIAIADVSWIFLVYGIVIIYLGPKINNLFENRFNVKFSLVLSGFVAALGLLVFGLGQGLPIVFISAVIFALGDSFGLPVQQSYFMSLKASRRLGGSNSLAIYSAIESIGQVIGPVLFGLALILGVQKGLFIMGAVMVAMLILFGITSIGDLKHLKKDN